MQDIMMSRIRQRRSAVAGISHKSPRPVFGLALVIFLASLSSTSADHLHSLCPSGYSGFVLADLCSRVAWCSSGNLEFHTNCGEGQIFDASTMTCRSDSEYSCPTSTPSDMPTDGPTVSRSPSSSPTDLPTTDLPTSISTHTPSATPTGPPTVHPTASSSSTPTISLSHIPSSSPSLGHSSTLSISHSAEPSLEHSSTPSQSTTVKPSAVPSPPEQDLNNKNYDLIEPELPSVPTSEPAYVPVTVIVEGTKFEIAITEVNIYLFNRAFTELNNILDGMIISNLALPMGIQDAKFSTVLMSQGIKHRFKNDEGRLAISPLTQTRFYPSAQSPIVTRPKSYDVNLSDDEHPLHVRQLRGGEEKVEQQEQQEQEGAVERELQRSTTTTLFAVLQKKLYITVPAIGPYGKYNKDMIPTVDEMNRAVSTMLRDQTQNALFASWLRASDVDDFNDVNQVDFVGFVSEYFTQPENHQSEVLMSTTKFPGGQPVI